LKQGKIQKSSSWVLHKNVYYVVVFHFCSRLKFCSLDQSISHLLPVKSHSHPTKLKIDPGVVTQVTSHPLCHLYQRIRHNISTNIFSLFSHLKCIMNSSYKYCKEHPRGWDLAGIHTVGSKTTCHKWPFTYNYSKADAGDVTRVTSQKICQVQMAVRAGILMFCNDLEGHDI